MWHVVGFVSLCQYGQQRRLASTMVREGGSTAWPNSLGWGWQAVSGVFALSFGFAASVAAHLALFPSSAHADHLFSSTDNPPDLEEAAKTEAENTITYSLLKHPEALDEETEHDYQNHI